MKVRLTNTLTRSCEIIEPLAGPGQPIRFYSCGPTVYDDAHIGNFRSFLNADILRRTLELVGHEVHHVMNITDVGHMTDDTNADGGGEDKMAVAGRRLLEAKKAGQLPLGTEIDARNPYAIAEFYAHRFLEDARHLGLKVAIEEQTNPQIMPRPSRCIDRMIELVQKLIAGGNAYQASDGAVYFDVLSFPKYGQLSGNTLQNLREGAGERINAAHQAVKRHPADFMLWKPDPNHIMRWPSPWGEGYPGWHLECSAMAAMLLGDEIDIHSGGEDNIFPHHECEIAQSCSAHHSESFSRNWFHTRHLLVEGEKMAKSKGNFFTVRDLFAKGITPAAIRLELVRTHYRVNSNFTLQGVRDCQRQVDRWCRVREMLAKSASAAGSPAPRGSAADRSAADADIGPIASAFEQFAEALCDDLNVAKAIGILNEACARVSETTSSSAVDLAALNRMDSVLGVLDRNTALTSIAADDLSAQVDALLVLRQTARAAKNFAESDRIRDQLAAMGVQIKDGPQGTTWNRA
ncbi:MAG: cysteine--tRNA ligase [Phycisphaerales bacterium]|nr:cysteine--tRNA ligase [Phycisphaerales bacterium]